MDQMTRKLMTMHKALYPRYDKAYMFRERKEKKDLPALRIA